MLILDIDGGVVTLRKKPGIDVVSVRSMEDIEKIYTTLYNSIEGEGSNRSMYYKTIGIDTLTELQKLDMRDIMRLVVQARPDLDPDVPSMREWGKTQDHIRKVVRGFRDLPCNVIFTCHNASVTDNHTNVTSMYPDLPGKLRTQITGFIDVVGYMTAVREDETTVRRIQFAKTQRVLAKDRTAALGDVMENPTIPMLWEKIHS